MLTLELPYSPNANHHFRRFQGRTVIRSAGGKVMVSIGQLGEQALSSAAATPGA